MKVCEYCDADVLDGTTTCPHCSSTKFLEKCPRCGKAYEGTVCPSCAEADQANLKLAEAQRAQEAAVQKANQGLVWKTALTFCIPFIGGYFLIRENVQRGFRIFGIAWCSFMAVMMGTASTGSPATRFLASLLCLAPIAAYLYKTKGRFAGETHFMGKLPLAGFAAVLIMAGAVGATNPSTPAATPAKSIATAPATAPATASLSSSSTNAASVVAAKDVELKPTSEYLEYSNKKTDPVKLVKCSEGTARVTADSKIDLSTVGDQTIRYKVAIGNDTATHDVGFTVRDTKAPSIALSATKPSIDQGQSFDPQSGISSVTDPVDGNLAKVDSEPEAHGSKAGFERFYDAGWFLIDGSIDPNTPGTYSLMVKASDKHGNVATKELLVTVNEVVQQSEEPAPAPATYTYIANKSSKKFHLPSCRDVAKMKESNKLEITATRQEMIEWGYSPCGHCHP